MPLTSQNERLKNDIRLLEKSRKEADENEGDGSKRYWTADEHKRFLEALKL